ITYWLIPYLSKRVLTPFMNKLGIIQTIIWTVGMLFMAGGMHWVGLYGAPRRTSYTTYGDSATALSWEPYMMLLAIGGTLLIIGVILMVYIIYNLMFLAPKGNKEFPIGEPEVDEAPKSKWTERWGLWIVLMLIVVSIGDLIPLADLIINSPPGSPPFKTW